MEEKKILDIEEKGMVDSRIHMVLAALIRGYLLILQYIKFYPSL